MLRLHLPPNLIAAAARDAVPVRVDVDLSAPPNPTLLPALALLQRWCGTGTPPKFIQLNRAQLRELANAVGAQAVFVEDGQMTEWRHPELVAAPPAGVIAPAPSSRPKPQNVPGATPLVVDGSEHFLALTLPSREHPSYAAALALVKENGFVLEPSNRKWWLRDRHKTLNLLATHGTRLRDEFGAQFTPNFEKNTRNLHAAEVDATVDETAGEFAVTVSLRAGNADETTLRSALAANRGYLEASGKIYLLDAAKLAKFNRAQRALAGDPNAALAPRRTQRVPAARAAEAQEILEQLSPNFQAPESWRTRSAVLRNLGALAPAPLPANLAGLLRPYQRIGVAWLWHLYRHELGGILADEMGLGKTIQALALLAASREAEVSGFAFRVSGSQQTVPSSTPLIRASTQNSEPETQNRRAALVVCPASLLENWRREAARFAPQLRVFVHHGERRLRSAAEVPAYDLVITSYGTLTRDQEMFSGAEFACIIADEAQHIKNRRSQNAAALRALRARSRFLLTGTPVENSLEDLRSLFEFLLPGYVPSVPAGLRGDERAWYDERLKAQTAPYILRRTKQSVAPELPEKLEQVIWCEMTAVQAALYRSTQERMERELFDLEAGGASEAKLKFAALTQLLRLRQICCDPRLVAHATPASPVEGDVGAGETCQGVETFVQPSYSDSAKLDAFRELLDEAIDDGHRILVFSQFTSLLALLRAELDNQQLAHCYLDGSMSPRARQIEVDRFQSSAEIPLFLLSLKAGGTGLNLTGADTVVHFDPWWNPAAEAQATDRVHRIGQRRVVTSYKLIAAGTVEEKVLALQEEKRALLAGVFEASDAVAAKLTLDDLKSLIRAPAAAAASPQVLGSAASPPVLSSEF
ncbi:MAG: DEAD/DEAH box helicase [Opitutaceae bacterium]|nr:DEAD/DEAH box helicase [Opitutaceae bacterium]